MSKKKKIKFGAKKIFFTLLFSLITYIIYTIISIYLYANVNETKVADAAIVLGAGVWDNKPSPVFEERIKHAIWLYKSGYVNKLIFTGGKGEGKQYSDSFIACQYAKERGVPANNIFIEEQSVITQENFKFAVDIIKHQNISSVLIVSDPLHMKRAMLMAKDYNLNAYSSPTQTTKYTSAKSKAKFLARETFFYIGYQIYKVVKPCLY